MLYSWHGKDGYFQRLGVMDVAAFIPYVSLINGIICPFACIICQPRHTLFGVRGKHVCDDGWNAHPRSPGMLGYGNVVGYGNVAKFETHMYAHLSMNP